MLTAAFQTLWSFISFQLKDENQKSKKRVVNILGRRTGDLIELTDTVI